MKAFNIKKARTFKNSFFFHFYKKAIKKNLLMKRSANL
ncbi:hypothetical protein KF7_1003 [Lactococcus lactis subsp. lactis]|nr:hypothetical protein KF7_1003 [Lactococcus lactis subsp. lactis]